MILRTTTGRSFKGVGQYVLHDKGAQSADRVSFIETDNLAFSQGDRAIAEMVHTATHQKEIKRRAGGRATQTSKPVYHLSLSWDTSENPTLKEQIQVGRDALKALGLGEHQAMIVGHTDTDNPHVHVVVNLVHPTTGQTAKLGNDRTTLSRWAQAWRKERGEEHFCPQRKANNARREQGEFVKADNLSRPEYEAWKKSQTRELWDKFRADRESAKASRKGQYDALWQQKENRLIHRKEEVKALFKPRWRDLYKKQRRELKNFDVGFFDRLGFALTRGGKSKVMGFLLAVTNDSTLRADFIRDQEREKKQLGQEHKARVTDASREVRKAWQYDRDQLKASHEAQDQRAYDATKAKSAEVWRGEDLHKSGQDFEQTADRRKDNETRQSIVDEIRENTPKEQQDAIRDRIRKRKERKRDRPRKRDTGRTMDR